MKGTGPSTVPASRASRDDLCGQPAVVLAAWLSQRKVSAIEVLEAHLRRIERDNDVLNAVVSLDEEGARKRAWAADAALARGDVIGPLHGVPLTLKDAHEVAGLRTTIGAPPFDHVADRDGAVASRLRAAGANIIGHTNVAAFLADPLQSENPLFGRTSNPWDSERVPGGSSGGAAAAVGAGMTPIEVGSDLAGSVRLPAHFCGVYGLKTTEHRIPLTGFFHIPGGPPRAIRIMSSLGPLARDLGDLELALDLLAGPDGHDSDVPPVPLEHPAASALPLAGLRLAIVSNIPGAGIARSARVRLERLAADVSDGGGVVTTDAPTTSWDELYALFGELAGTLTSLFTPGARLDDEQRSLARHFQNLERRDRIIATWQAFFGEVDALVLPTALTGAFSHRPTGRPIEVDGKPVSYWEHGRLAVIANLTGQPALTMPAGFDEDGLPMGVQIVGPRWSEPRLLDVARALELHEILPGFVPPPVRPGDGAPP